MALVVMACSVCRAECSFLGRDGDGVWTAFCSPEHAHAWQAARTEEQIVEECSTPEAHRCQWCGCRLKSGWHDNGCPVREVAEAERVKP